MKETTKAYWNSVGKRLLGISNIVLDMSVPVAVEAGINKACSIINGKLHDMYKSTVMNSLITLALNIAGMLIVCFKPFGEVLSNYVGAVFFIASMVFFLFRMINSAKEYGKSAFQISKKIIEKKSVTEGLELYIMEQFPAVSLAYTGIGIASNFLPSLKHIPSLQKTVKIFIELFWKKLLVYGLIVVAYSISVYWIAKPLLLRNVAELAWYDVYFYPVYHVISLFDKRSF